MTLRVLLVDDEELARRGLRDFLDDEPDVEIVGECASGGEAVTAIRELVPDLVLLDVQMPGMNGFEVLERLPPPLPTVVFVTAWDRYALQAFDAHAVDYLLKPVERQRFRRALARTRQAVESGRPGDSSARLAELVALLAPSGGARRRFMVKAGGKIRLIRAEEIRWIEAAGNYARLHTSDGRHSIRETMQSLEQQLDPAQFLRIHRSYIVNLDEVREIQHWVKGDLMVMLRAGGTLPLSRAYRSRLEQRLGRLP